MIRIGRFRILFTRKGSGRAVRWYGMSVGYEGKWLRDWKNKIRAKAEERRRIDKQCLAIECAAIIIIGMACGKLIRLFVEGL